MPLRFEWHFYFKIEKLKCFIQLILIFTNKYILTRKSSKRIDVGNQDYDFESYSNKYDQIALNKNRSDAWNLLLASKEYSLLLKNSIDFNLLSKPKKAGRQLNVRYS